MRISYRQGLISAQSNFLQIGQQNSQYVDVVVSPTPVIAAIASGAKDYLIAESRSVSNAWGPFTDSLTHYLYWEINRVDGTLMRGETTIPIIVSGTAPNTPLVNQMWWDSSTAYMKLWNGSRWNVVLRVFAGSITGSVITPEPFSSQVSLNTPVDAGYLASDGLGGVFRASNGDFLTTNTPIVAQDTGSLVKLDGAQVTVQANENIPRFSAVYLAGGRAALASSAAPDNIIKAPIALVTVDAYQNDSVDLVTSGRLVVNEQWAWSNAELGKTVYCNNTGQLTTLRPTTLKCIRVGTIVSANSVLLNFDWETEPAVPQSGVLGLNTTAPLSSSGPANYPTLSVAQASNSVDGFLSAIDFARIEQLETDMASKADVSHLHAMVDVVGLGAALLDKADSVHTHAIADVTNLQSELDLKINSADLSPVATSGDYADLINVPTINDITGITEPTAGHLLRYDGTRWIEGDVLPPSNIYFWVNEIIGDDTHGNGSINRPFKTIQQAIDEYTGINGCVINVLAGSYIGDVNITKNGITLIGVGTTDSQMIEIMGHVTVASGVTRFRARDIQFDGQTGGVPTVTFDNTQGRHYFDNCTFVHAGGSSEIVLQWQGSCQRWHDFTTCWIGGQANFGGTPTSNCQARFTMCDGDASMYNVSHSNWTVRIQNTYRVGTINHYVGEVILNDVMEFTTTNPAAINSTAMVGGKNRLLLNNINMRRPDGTFKGIAKSGDCPFMLTNVIRSAAADTLNGALLGLGPYAGDLGANVKVEMSTNYDATITDDVIIMLNTAARTVQLPIGVIGKMITIKDGGGVAATFPITVSCIDSANIDGTGSNTIDTNYGVAKYVFTGGAGWMKI